MSSVISPSDISTSTILASVKSTTTGNPSTWTSFIYKLFKTGLIFGTSVVVVSLLAIYKFQSKIIYPASLNDGHGTVDTPDKYGMPEYQAVDLKTADGETLKAYVLLHDPTAPNYSNKTVLILCPNAGNMGHFLPVVSIIYRSMNYNVIIYSYRGYGKSTGSPSERGLKIDADAVMEYISNNKQLCSSSLILYGRSLGGAVAIYMASKYSDMVNAVILENTFLGIRKVIPHIFPYLAPFKILCHQIWDSESDMAKIPSNIPVCFFSGLKDEIVPPEHMKKLYDISKSDAKEWHSYPNATHNDTIVQPRYFDIFQTFAQSKVNPIGL
ncbi:hypothetical protein B5S28_g240 [[Candida] boidinii]|uniref:Unnamed protein product n=1 Tax=Candida boidinii TaxID=5477 RepID=A0ACB5U0D7_CANBO|nr:hypothetical protein B5S28_g240 [[Candida] boidinii]OWB59969.1 hypothetical protein B5S29_g834 [[Candida] boidinii]OWB77354.1 hypothetical protein B5S32_g1518 [[Candida] boidinii]GME97560.1 unnamed protein product [[Candida] boidinii]